MGKTSLSIEPGRDGTGRGWGHELRPHQAISKILEKPGITKNGTHRGPPPEKNGLLYSPLETGGRPRQKRFSCACGKNTSCALFISTKTDRRSFRRLSSKMTKTQKGGVLYGYALRRGKIEFYFL